MVKEFEFKSINIALDKTLRHALLLELSLEQVIDYLDEFIGIFGFTKFYQDKEVILSIENYRCLLPCDLVSINQVKDTNTNKCLRSTTDMFSSGTTAHADGTFKTLGKILYTSFDKGEILISYKATPIDENGYPMIIDNPVFIKCFDAYIKKEFYTDLFELGKIQGQVLDRAELRYAWLAGQLQSEFNIPSISEMESLKNSHCTLRPRTNEFSTGFKYMGSLEYTKLH